MRPPSSSPSTSSRSGPRYGRWFALAVAAVIGAGAYWFGGPIYGAASFMIGRPYRPGCTATVTKEETVADLRYRIAEQTCANGPTRHYVFVARAHSVMSFMMTPAFMSIESPVPLSVSKEGERTYNIAIKPPLEDDANVVELFIGPSGVPLEVHIYDRGRKR